MRLLALDIVFWLCIGAVAYNYLGYPVVLFSFSMFSQAKSDLLFLLGKRARRQPRLTADIPSVAILLSAYNEATVIREKVNNFLALDYPRDELEMLIGLDASNDGTAAILAELHNPRVRVFQFSERQGKMAVLSLLAQQATSDIVITTDANTMMDTGCVRMLMRHFVDPRVGAATGEENRITAPGTDPAGESFYWRYESALKFLENRLNCTLGGNGSVLAVRRSLFRLDKPAIVEDFQIPMDIRFLGYRVVYDPEATVVEDLPPNLSAQFSRRIRLGAGDFQALFGNLSCLNPAKGLPAFCFFSHRVLRWLTPLFLLVALLCSLLGLPNRVFAVLLALQCLFYSSALAGFQRKKQGKSAGIFALPLHFCSMNLALLLGFVQYLRGGQSLAWKATPRTPQQEVVESRG